MKYKLKNKVILGQGEYDIRTNYDVVLTIIEVLNDATLTAEEKVLTSLDLFYPDFLHIPSELLSDATTEMLKYIGGKELGNKKMPKLMDWEQDFPYLVGAINRVLGFDIRGTENVSWETFLSAYYEIGDCFFAQIVRIRDLKAKGKLKDKTDKEFYRKNKAIIDIKSRYSQAEEDIIKGWT